MPQLLLCRLWHPVAALTGTLLLHACSQASTGTATGSSPLGSPSAAATHRPAGTAADSLNGTQGHTFGEPLRNFPGLVLVSEKAVKGVRVYQMPAAKKRGWFGKHAKEVATYYQFQDGQFAMFRAVTTGLGANRTALRAEVRFLFGPG